jgi:hypothetical protein
LEGHWKGWTLKINSGLTGGFGYHFTRRDYQYCLGYREGRGGIVEEFEIAHLERFSLEMFSHFTSEDYFCV